MADDDDRTMGGDDAAADDPWANLDQPAPAGEQDETFDFSFDESLDVGSQEAAAPEVTAAVGQPESLPPPEEPAPDSFAASAAEATDAASMPAGDGAGDAASEDAFAESWLDDAAEVTDPASSAASEAGSDDAAASGSTVRIGSGESGIAETSGVDPDAWPSDDATASDEEPATIAFNGELGSVALAAAPAAGRRKSGGLGQVAGIVGGGVMSIPIVVGILLWGFQRDPFGAAKVLPSFLLPQKFRDRDATGGFPKAPSLDDASARAAQVLEGGGGPGTDATAPADDAAAPADVASDGDGAAAGTAAPEPSDPTAAIAVDPPAEPPADPAEPAVPAVPLDDVAADPATEPTTDPAAAPEDPVAPPATDIAALPAEPMEDAPGDAAVTTFEPPVAQPPLDFASLDGAVAEAREALDVAASVEAIEGPAHDRGLVSWYRSLAGVGSELVALEAEAVETGRSIDDAAERLAALRGALASQPALADDLERLARNWLDYGRRDSDGVILPVTFAATRKVGPNWYTTVFLTEADGGTREVAVLSRREPAAVEGDRLLVLGVLFDDGVVYAAEIGPLEEPSDAGGFFGAGGF